MWRSGKEGPFSATFVHCPSLFLPADCDSQKPPGLTPSLSPFTELNEFGSSPPYQAQKTLRVIEFHHLQSGCGGESMDEHISTLLGF